MSKQQLTRIQSALAQAHSHSLRSQGGGIIVTGEAGAGKSHLVEQSLAGVNRPVSRGRCREDEAYAPFTDMLIDLLGENPKVIPPAARLRILTQVPSLASHLRPQGVSETSPRSTGHSRQDQLLFFGMMITVMEGRVLVIDDAHRIDQASLSLLNFLLKRGNIFALLLARSGEPLSQLAGLESVHVAPLSEAEVADLVGEILGGGTIPPALIQAVARRSRGNPTYIRAIVEHLREQGAITALPTVAGGWTYNEAQDTTVAPEVKDLLSSRFARLQAVQRRSLAIAGLIGEDFTISALSEVAGGGYKTQDAVAAGEEAGIVERTGDRCYFSPPEVGRLLAEAISGAERLRLHREIAGVLAGQPFPEEQAARIAHHYEQGNDAGKAAQWFITAARRAMAVNTLSLAAQYAGRAQSLKETMEASDLLGDIYRQQGDAERAIRQYQAAQQQAAAAGRVDEQARILNSLALTYWLYDRNEEAQSVVGMVMALDGAPPAERAAAESHLGMIYWQLGWLTQGKAACESAVRAMKDLDNSPAASAASAGALNRLGLCCLSLGEFAWADVAFKGAMERRRKLGDMWGTAFGLNNLAKLDIERGNTVAALIKLAEAEKIFTEIESRDGLMVVHTNQGRAHIRGGNIETAMPLLKKALWLALEIGKKEAYGLADIHLLIAEAHLEAGRLSEAEESIEAGVKLAQAGGNREYIGIGYGLRARLLAELGDKDAARLAHRQAVDMLGDIGAKAALRRVERCFSTGQ